MTSMPEPEPAITLTAATAADQNFLMAVFGSTREHELAALGDSPLIESLISMQFKAQQQSYREAYAEAEDSIVLLDHNPIGRILVERSGETIRLVDIALLTEFRGRGIGSILLRRLLDEGAAAGKRVVLSVYKFNPAMRLYERFGFFKVAEDGLYVQMQWSDFQEPRNSI
jgi:ribosomal protein S18 acetylase RimI-like enzyme